jgi:CDP-diacylglycerol pyrophosphatase
LLFFFRRSARTTILCFLIAYGAVFPTQTVTAESRDTLWDIVTTCLDTHAQDYCKQCPAPRIESPCAQGRGCKETTEVWEETTEFVIIRDRKMCGCPEGFVHGLVIPRARIKGVEDPQRPKNIWSTAWAMARKRIGDAETIALVVNAPGIRSQDQLHVHIVRLRSDSRRLFDAAKVTRVRSLDDVWSEAAKEAARANLNKYGVLVTPNPDGDFLVVVEDASLEKLYTQWECR